MYDFALSGDCLTLLAPSEMSVLKLEEPPNCESCNTPLTVEHIIIHCRKYLREKQQRNIKASQQNTLKEIKTTQNLLLTLSNALSIYKLNYKTEYKLNL